MLDNATSSLKVEPLDGNNWFTFRPAMTACFQQRGLWRVVTGDILLPPIPVYFVATGTPVVPLTAQEVLANSMLENNFDRKNNSWFDKDKKARGDLQAHVLVTQRVHIEEESTAYAMWQALIKMHVQQVPGMCFNTYNNMFLIAKAPGEDLTSVAARAKQALARVQELRPATVTDSTGASIAYGIQHLDNELALMAMLCALPRDEYGDFVSSLMHTKDLSCKDVEAAFQVEQTERNASHGPLYTPAGDTALRMQDTRRGNRPAPSSTPTTPGKGCAFYEALNHKEASCWAKAHAADAARARTKELQEERSKNKKAGRTSRAATAATGTSTGATTKPTVTKSAARTSVRLAGTHNTHTDAHWIADSGATSHMSTQRRWFKTFEPHVVPIRVANNAIVYSEGISSIVMELLDESLDPVCLSRVLYVPALHNNLFAVLHLVTSHCFRVVIEGTVMEFLRNSVRILTATIRDKTAWLNVRTVNAPESTLCGKAIRNCSLWHRRLGHIGKDLLEKVIRGKLASGLHLNSDAPLLVHCEPCIVGKHHANPFPAKASHRATRMLERIHSDLHMVPTATASGYCYWMTFINNWSRYGWIYLLKHKLDAFKVFKTFKAMVEKQYDLLILCFHEDKGGEYIGHVWDEFFAEHGIWRKHTVTGLSQQNGVAERQNRTLEEHVMAMLNNACLPIRFWGEALSYYARLLNMCPLAAIPANTTPYKMANKRKPDYSTLRTFGCRAWAHVRKDKHLSLEPHAKPCVFLGIPDNFKGWKLWDPLVQGGRGGVIISRNVVWSKEEFPGTSKTTLDPIPARFSRPTDAEPVPEAPEHKEMEDDSVNAGGAQRRLPGTFDVGLDPGRAGDSSAGSSLSSSSDSEDSEPPPAPIPPAPHTPPHPVVRTPVPATPRPAHRQIETPTGHCRAPAPAPAPVAAAPDAGALGQRHLGACQTPCRPKGNWLQMGVQGQAQC
jgi:transposase InsO family protein